MTDHEHAEPTHYEMCHDCHPWMVTFTGAGFSRTERHPSEESAYGAARTAAKAAIDGRPVTFVRGGRTEERSGVLGIRILRWNPDADDWQMHARLWSRRHPRPDALTPLTN